MSSLPGQMAVRQPLLFQPGVQTHRAVSTLLNADRISGDGDGNLGRGEMLRYGDFANQQVGLWQSWHSFLSQFGLGHLVENQLRHAEAEQQHIQFITEHAAGFSGADGNGATISRRDLQLVAARDGDAARISDADFVANPKEPFTTDIVNTLIRADRASGDGNGLLGRGEMLRYGDQVRADLEKARAAGNQVEINRLAAEQASIQFITEHAADFSGADGNGATISARDVRIVAARDGNAASISGQDFKPFTPDPQGNREQQLRAYFQSPEFSQLNLSPSETIRFLYTTVLEREPDLGGRQHWEAQYSNGMSLNDILTAFFNSAEYQARFGG